MSAVHTPLAAQIVERTQESSDIFTLRLRYRDTSRQSDTAFAPGQFHMIALHGVGEVPISIVNDPQDAQHFDHTIRAVGRVTHGLDALRIGDWVGVRGPFGRGWPVAECEGRDLVLLTGGLGCAPLVSVIEYVTRRRENYGCLVILQGVKHRNDLIWRERYDAWARLPNTEVLLAADVVEQDHGLFRGTVVELFHRCDTDLTNSVAMLCGPEPMMLAAVGELRGQGLSDQEIWLSLERNMHCGMGLCGHCQLGPKFVCQDGPVFRYDELAEWFGKKGV
jgi:NAD(P)H-flavin reductase